MPNPNTVDLVFGDATVNEKAKPYVNAKLSVDEKGQMHIVLPATYDLGLIQRTQDGEGKTLFITVKTDALDLNITTKTPDGVKERVLTTWPVSFRLNLKMK